MAVAGPATTQLADDNDDDGREMDFDDVRDFADQDLPCPQSYNGLIGPFADFLSAMPDWVNISESDITQGTVITLKIYIRIYVDMQYPCIGTI